MSLSLKKEFKYSVLFSYWIERSISRSSFLPILFHQNKIKKKINKTWDVASELLCCFATKRALTTREVKIREVIIIRLNKFYVLNTL